MDGAGPRWVYFVLSWPPIGEFGEERVPYSRPLLVVRPVVLNQKEIGIL